MEISVGDVFVCHKMWNNWEGSNSRVGDKIIVVADMGERIEFMWGTGAYVGEREIYWIKSEVGKYFTKIG